MSTTDNDRDWIDVACELYDAEQRAIQMKRWTMRLFVRLAFSRWRRVLLWAATARASRLCPRMRDDMLDALYPDDCIVRFAGAGCGGAVKQA